LQSFLLIRQVRSVIRTSITCLHEITYYDLAFNAVLMICKSRKSWERTRSVNGMK